MDIEHRKSKPQNLFDTHIYDENKLRENIFKTVILNPINKKEGKKHVESELFCKSYTFKGIQY